MGAISVSMTKHWRPEFACFLCETSRSPYHQHVNILFPLRSDRYCFSAKAPVDQRSSIKVSVHIFTADVYLSRIQ